MTLVFPPPNPQAFNINPFLFDRADITQDGTTIGLPSSPVGLNTISREGGGDPARNYDPLWSHLLNNYWSELYDNFSLGLILEPGVPADKPATEPISFANGLVKKQFETLLDEFEVSEFGNGTESFIKRKYGKEAADFYTDFSTSQRLEVWEHFLRQTDLGMKRYNVFMYVWEILLQILFQMQITALNKAVGQQWIAVAQEKSIEEMEKLSDNFIQQTSSQDFGATHDNTVTNHLIDILRIERQVVQRRSSEMGQAISTALEKSSEMNTFVKALLDQLQGALRGVLRI